MEWEDVVDTEAHPHVQSVFNFAEEWLSHRCGVTHGLYLSETVWRSEGNGTDHIYAFCNRLPRNGVMRVHWHTCCQDHPVCITKVEFTRQ